MPGSLNGPGYRAPHGSHFVLGIRLAHRRPGVAVSEPLDCLGQCPDRPDHSERDQHRHKGGGGERRGQAATNRRQSRHLPTGEVSRVRSRILEQRLLDLAHGVDPCSRQAIPFGGIKGGEISGSAGCQQDLPHSRQRCRSVRRDRLRPIGKGRQFGDELIEQRRLCAIESGQAEQALAISQTRGDQRVACRPFLTRIFLRQREEIVGFDLPGKCTFDATSIGERARHSEQTGNELAVEPIALRWRQLAAVDTPAQRCKLLHPLPQGSVLIDREVGRGGQSCCDTSVEATPRSVQNASSPSVLFARKRAVAARSICRACTVSPRIDM